MSENTVTVTWAHHHEWEGEAVKPGDSVQMDVETARAHAAAGMLTVDPEDPVAMEQIGIEVPSTQTDMLAGGEAVPPFDPTHATVDEVNTYLSTADDNEKIRVLDVERGNKNRSSVSGI